LHAYFVSGFAARRSRSVRSATSDRQRRFRFGLRTLLAVVAVAVVVVVVLSDF
jgi:uncharacterized membrane protein YccC